MFKNLSRAAGVIFGIILAPISTDAFYNSHLGRWTSRDPLVESNLIGESPHFQVAGDSKFHPRDAQGAQTARENWQDSLQRQLQNLYVYVGSTPLSHADPSGLFFGFSYGNYCGFNTAGPGTPIDSLDRACQAHDNCLATPMKFLCFQIPCNMKLCDQAKKAAESDCKADWPTDPAKRRKCEGAAMLISVYACSPLMQSPVPGSGNDPWPPHSSFPY